MLDKFKRTKQTQNKKGDYLKYQEGEVVPVHSKQVAYPPFLNDEDEISVKQYKDILREQQEKDRQAMPASSSKNNTRQSAGQETPSKDDNPKKQSVGLSGKWLLRFVWLVVLGGLIYYAIPIFQHFTSETPNLANVEESIGNVTEPIEESTVVDDVSEGTKAIVNEVQETTEGLAEKSGLVEKANESFVTDTKDTDQDLVQLPDDQWLNTLSSTHNTKQQKLMEIQGYTAAFANGEISHNRYKMLMKGINKDLQRQRQAFKSFIEGKDLNQQKEVVGIVSTELKQLQELAVALSSISEKNAISRFNEGVSEQNELNESYKITFKNLLTQMGKVFKEENGKIIY